MENMTGAAFAAIRNRMGLKQGELAENLGYGSKTRISEFENDKTPIPVHLSWLMMAMDETGWRPKGWTMSTDFEIVDHALPQTIAETIGAAEATMRNAQKIAAGGIGAARRYIEAKSETQEKPTPQKDIGWKAFDALECAKKIVADGRAWYVFDASDGAKMFVGCTLLADASAGPDGYEPVTRVKMKGGKITHYEAWQGPTKDLVWKEA